ncbi:hypothetical protein ES708_33467 [subsurface metagenome]
MPKMTYEQLRTWIRRVAELAAEMSGAVAAIKYLVGMLGDDYESDELVILGLCQEAEDIIAHIAAELLIIEEQVDRAD